MFGVGLAFAGWMIAGQITHIKDNQIAAARHTTLVEKYASDRLNWVHDTDEYNACINDAKGRVERSDGLRAALGSIIDLTDVLPDESLAQLYRKNRQAVIDVSFPKLDLTMLTVNCTVPGPEPTPPQ